MLRALIVDDEPLAREELRLLLEASTGIEVVGECGHALEALPAIHGLKPDVLFLDIQMPRISGLELVGMLDPEQLPHIVFVTAFDEYALRAFEEHALDYLLKPVDPARLQRTLDRLLLLARREVMAPEREGGVAPGSGDPSLVAAPLRTIPCVGHNRILLLPLAEVEYVHSDLAGNRVVAGDRQGTTELTLRTLEEKSGFLRCHRQYLLNPALIREILLLDGGLAEVVTCGGHKVPVSRRYLRPLKDQLAIP
jgi:two-component system, LytTR family, response regulator